MANLALLNTLKGFFSSGATPSQSDFEQLIDATADATIINTGVVDAAHLPSNLDLTQQGPSSVAAHAFIGDGAQLANLNANHIGSGTLNSERLPSLIDLTHFSEPSRLSVDAVHADNARYQEITTQIIKAELDSGEVLDALTLNQGQARMAVKQGNEYIQDDVANKNWVTGQVENLNSEISGDVSNVSNVVDTLSNHLISERERAVGVEASLEQTLQSEVSARQTADSEIEDKLTTQTLRIDTILDSAGADTNSFSEIVNLVNSIDAESDDSLVALNTSVNNNQHAIATVNASLVSIQDVSTNLQGSITHLDNKLIQEANRAQGIEVGLQGQINTEKARVDGFINDASGNSGSLQTLTEQVNVNQTDISNLQASTGDIGNAANDLGAHLSAEEHRAQTAENNLQTNIDGEYQRAITAENNLQLNLDNIFERANTVENNLQGSITGLTARADATEGTLQGHINTEVARAQAAENILQDNINNETSRAQQQEDSLQVNLNDQSLRLDGQQEKTESLNSIVRETHNGVVLGKEDNSLHINVVSNCTAQHNLWVDNAIFPSPGNTAFNGINFGNDIGGGTGDSAWIRHYGTLGESTVLEMGISNDADDHIAFMASGNVGVSTTEPLAKFHVNGNALANAWNTQSDARLKENIKPLQDPLTMLAAIHGVSFDWQDTKRKAEEGPQVGVIAQQVEAVLPQVVYEDTNGYKSVDYSKLVAPLIEAVKQLNSKVEVQQLQISNLLANS